MMGDIALRWSDERMAADVEVASNDLAVDSGLESSVWISLFTDRRDADARGWWADALTTGEPTGSRLWLLARSKDTPDVLRLAETYAREALAWMVLDGVAAEVRANASKLSVSESRYMLLLAVAIQRPDGTTTSFRYAYNWEAQEARRHASGV
jgi:phage gp46-like protein